MGKNQFDSWSIIKIGEINGFHISKHIEDVMEEKSLLRIAAKKIKYIGISLLYMRPVWRKLWNIIQGHEKGLEEVERHDVLG